MTQRRNKRHVIAALAIVILIPILIVGGFGMYGLSQADKLPWQTAPTRIPVVPVEMPSFGTMGGSPQASPAAELVPTP